MDHDSFIGEVQNRAELASRGEALSASRATLQTLAERIEEGEATNLAAQLPDELGRFLEEGADATESFDFREFVGRVAEREENLGGESGVDDEDRSDAAFHARAVVGVLDEAVTEGQIEDLRDQLPGEYADLFELAEAEGSPGQA
ncbi:MAG: DUF2267 domain-containing protein [Halalkalicoccus sp.]|nr:DUF2267 domain-containing protein [Halalkalicoccus sp.]